MEKTNLTSGKDLVKKFYENFERTNYNEVEKLLSDNSTLTISGSTKKLNKTESLELMKAYKSGFPDLTFKVTQQLTDGDYVISRVTATGTHKGSFIGFAPTNKKATMTTISIHRIVNNKIVEETTEFDRLSLLQQLGVLPESATELKEHHVN